MRLAALAVLLVAACKEDSASKPVVDSAPPASSPVAVASSAAPIDAAAFTVAAVTTTCRLIVVSGEATLPDAGTLRSLDAAPSDFITLPAGSSLTAKDTKSGREVTLKGQARGRVCVGGKEETWLAQGEFASVPGAGETPGSEVWVVTLHGVARYALGHVHVTAKDKTTRVRGGASVFPPPSGTMRGIDAGTPSVDAEGWAHVTDGELEIESAPKTAELIDACGTAAAAARNVARQMMAGDGGNIGELGAQNVVLRRRARALCGMAYLGVSLASPHSSADEARVTAAEAMWHEVPTR